MVERCLRVIASSDWVIELDPGARIASIPPARPENASLDASVTLVTLPANGSTPRASLGAECQIGVLRTFCATRTMQATTHAPAGPPPPAGAALRLTLLRSNPTRQIAAGPSPHRTPPLTRPPAMILHVLGCSGAIAAGCKTTAFLLDGDVLIDAGTGAADLPLEALARIDHILVSHSHLDHVLAIGLLADSVMRPRRAQGRGPIQVHALPETLAALRSHIFNGLIWPDFTRLPSAEAPTLQFVPFAVGDRLALNGKCVEVLSAAHTVPAVGFAVACLRVGDPPSHGAPDTAPHGASNGSGDDLLRWWVYTGDTGPNPRLWARLRHLHVAHLVIETAFSDAEQQLAQISRHLSPTALGAELAQLDGSIDVHITHIKPGELGAVMGEIGRLTSAHRIRALSAGQSIDLSVV